MTEVFVKQPLALPGSAKYSMEFGEKFILRNFSLYIWFLICLQDFARQSMHCSLIFRGKVCSMNFLGKLGLATYKAFILYSTHLRNDEYFFPQNYESMPSLPCQKKTQFKEPKFTNTDILLIFLYYVVYYHLLNV